MLTMTIQMHTLQYTLLFDTFIEEPGLHERYTPKLYRIGSLELFDYNAHFADKRDARDDVSALSHHDTHAHSLIYGQEIF